MANIEYKNLIKFVKEKEEAEVGTKQKIVEPNQDGNEVKAFYEQLIKTDLDETNTKGRKRKRNSVSSHEKCMTGMVDPAGSNSFKNEVKQINVTVKVKDESRETFDTDDYISDRLARLGNEFLRHAEQGNLNNVKRSHEQGVNVNHSDAYGWTALMCASVARHAELVEYLLKSGAQKCLRNNQGKTAVKLAEEVGAYEIVELIENYDTRQKKDRNGKSKKFSETVFCDICNCEFPKSSSEDKSHYSSTVHLFNLKLAPKPDPFMISETNVGYKLMRQAGWDGEKGLGPKGQGHKYPVKTTLKTDRSCLGATNHKSKSKVTHYGPNDPEAVNSYQRISQRVMSVRTVSRKERHRKEKKAKDWERNLRMEMNID